MISTKKQQFSTFIIIGNVYWEPNKYIRMISNVTEDWSNDAENTALITGIFQYIKIESSYFKLK